MQDKWLHGVHLPPLLRGPKILTPPQFPAKHWASPGLQQAEEAHCPRLAAVSPFSKHSWERTAADNHSLHTSLGNTTFQCFSQPKQIQINIAGSAAEKLIQAGVREETLPLLHDLAGKD